MSVLVLELVLVISISISVSISVSALSVNKEIMIKNLQYLQFFKIYNTTKNVKNVHVKMFLHNLYFSSSIDYFKIEILKQ